MCSSFLQLAPGSRDLSEAEKKITFVKDEQTDYRHPIGTFAALLVF